MLRAQALGLCFCHGTPWSSALWRRVADALSVDFTVYLWDMLGYGSGMGHLRGGRSHYPDAAAHAQRPEIPVVGLAASRSAPGHMTTATLVVSGPRPSLR